jgi:hypothetical protein
MDGRIGRAEEHARRVNYRDVVHQKTEPKKGHIKKQRNEHKIN